MCLNVSIVELVFLMDLWMKDILKYYLSLFAPDKRMLKKHQNKALLTIIIIILLHSLLVSGKFIQTPIMLIQI